jgi:protein-disulfide isomerase
LTSRPITAIVEKPSRDFDPLKKTLRAAKIGGPKVKIGLWTTLGCVLLTAASLACAQEIENAEDPAVARIGDEVITESQLEALVGTSLVSIRQQIYDTRVAKLEDEIYRRLLQKAAADEGLTEADYLRKHIDQKVGEPDEGEIVKLMSQFRARLAEDDVQARAQVVQALKQRENQRLSEELRRVLFAEAEVKILLEPPRVEFTVAEGTPSRGAADAPVILIEYTDYQCPYCTRIQPTLNELLKRYEGKLLHVFKNLPLPMHAEAPLAGAAALCAQDQGKFWELHDWLFVNQRSLSRESIVAAAGELGMDTEVLSSCIDQGTYASRVKSETAEAHSHGITGTPGFLINGRVVTGARPIEMFVEIIDDELARLGVELPPKEAVTEAAN